MVIVILRRLTYVCMATSLGASRALWVQARSMHRKLGAVLNLSIWHALLPTHECACAYVLVPGGPLTMERKSGRDGTVRALFYLLFVFALLFITLFVVNNMLAKFEISTLFYKRVSISGQ
jgi:hypothetical protein